MRAAGGAAGGGGANGGAGAGGDASTAGSTGGGAGGASDGGTANQVRTAPPALPVQKLSWTAPRLSYATNVRAWRVCSFSEKAHPAQQCKALHLLTAFCLCQVSATSHATQQQSAAGGQGAGGGAIAGGAAGGNGQFQAAGGGAAAGGAGQGGSGGGGTGTSAATVDSASTAHSADGGARPRMESVSLLRARSRAVRPVVGLPE